MVLTRTRNSMAVSMRGAGDADENDGRNFANQRAISDYLHEASASPVSSTRSQGFGLCNTRTQLLKMNVLYQDDEEHSNNGLKLDVSLDKGRNETSFYLTSCVSKEGRNSMSPLYAASSTASSSSEDDDENDDSDFLIEARASLVALQEWETFYPMPPDHDMEDIVSSCDASCSSSFDGNMDDDVVDALNQTFDSQSACDFRYGSHPALDTPRSCPDIFPRKRTLQQKKRPVSTKSWLQEIKDEELLQRKRIADAIAASSKNNNNHPATTPQSRKSSRRGSSVLKNSAAKLFRNKENLENKGGRHSKLMRSIRSWQSPKASFGRKQQQQQQRQSTGSEGFEARDDRNDSTANQLASPIRKQQEASNSNELQLKRAFLGSARVVTMDGIVESFANNDSAPPKNALEAQPVGKRSFAPTSDAPLTWV